MGCSSNKLAKGSNASYSVRCASSSCQCSTTIKNAVTTELTQDQLDEIADSTLIKIHVLTCGLHIVKGAKYVTIRVEIIRKKDGTQSMLYAHLLDLGILVYLDKYSYGTVSDSFVTSFPKSVKAIRFKTERTPEEILNIVTKQDNKYSIKKNNCQTFVEKVLEVICDDYVELIKRVATPEKIEKKEGPDN